jgi:hypothetical protein
LFLGAPSTLARALEGFGWRPFFRPEPELALVARVVTDVMMAQDERKVGFDGWPPEASNKETKEILQLLVHFGGEKGNERVVRKFITSFRARAHLFFTFKIPPCQTLFPPTINVSLTRPLPSMAPKKSTRTRNVKAADRLEGDLQPHSPAKAPARKTTNPRTKNPAAGESCGEGTKGFLIQSQ